MAASAIAAEGRIEVKAWVTQQRDDLLYDTGDSIALVCALLGKKGSESLGRTPTGGVAEQHRNATGIAPACLGRDTAEQRFNHRKLIASAGNARLTSSSVEQPQIGLTAVGRLAADAQGTRAVLPLAIGEQITRRMQFDKWPAMSDRASAMPGDSGAAGGTRDLKHGIA